MSSDTRQTEADKNQKNAWYIGWAAAKRTKDDGSEEEETETEGGAAGEYVQDRDTAVLANYVTSTITIFSVRVRDSTSHSGACSCSCLA